MSCELCDDAPLHGAYLRVGDSTVGFGNVEIVACRKHWKWAREKLLAPAPLFTPEEIEAWRVVRGYMEEFGFKDEEGRKNSPWLACDVLDALFAEKMSAPSEKP